MRKMMVSLVLAILLLTSALAPAALAGEVSSAAALASGVIYLTNFGDTNQFFSAEEAKLFGLAGGGKVSTKRLCSGITAPEAISKESLRALLEKKRTLDGESVNKLYSGDGPVLLGLATSCLGDSASPVGIHIDPNRSWKTASLNYPRPIDDAKLEPLSMEVYVYKGGSSQIDGEPIDA